MEGLTRNVGNRELLHGISLEIQKGEIFTLIGPSGSGKTTLLRLLDVLDLPTSGTIRFDGRDPSADEAARLAIRRRIGMVFQKPAVMNTTVEENVALGLKFRGVAPGERAGRVRQALDLVGLAHLATRKATTLSGGEMQRVAVARAVVTDPEVLLLDEPTANLDPVSAEVIENLVIRINREKGTTVVMATHDMIQGQRLGHRIGAIMDGRLVQVGSGTDIFSRPTSREIARFVGIDTMLEGIITANDSGLATISVGGNIMEAVTPLPQQTPVSVFIRPEEVAVSLPDQCTKSSVRNRLPGIISRMVPYGPFIRVTIDCGPSIVALITRRSCTDLGLAVGTPVVASIKATTVHVLARPPYSP